MKPSISQHVVLGVIRGYQLVLSPLLHALGGPGCGCRFQPTCSVYAMEAVRSHGVIRGCWLAAKRLGRCQPWGGHGYDPVPPAQSWHDVLDNRIRK